MIIVCVFGGFSEFAYQNSLVREFIRTRKNKRGSVVEEDKQLDKLIDNTEPVVFSYISYLIAKYRVVLCCCCKGSAQQEKDFYDKTFEMMSKEVDITRFIKASRTTHLMTKMLLKPNQTKLVKYFKRYQVEDGDEPEEHVHSNATAAELLTDFQPETDPVDKLIKREIEGDDGNEAGDEGDDDAPGPANFGSLVKKRASQDRMYSLIN